MRKTLTILALLVPSCRRRPPSADDDCFVPMADWQPREAVRAGRGEGWTVRRIKIDDGCYEIDGRDADRDRAAMIEVTVVTRSELLTGWR